MISVTFGPVSAFATGLFLGFVFGVVVAVFDFRKKIFPGKDKDDSLKV